VTTLKNYTKNNPGLLQYNIFKCLGTSCYMKSAVLIEITTSSHNKWLYESLFSQLPESEEQREEKAEASHLQSKNTERQQENSLEMVWKNMKLWRSYRLQTHTWSR